MEASDTHSVLWYERYVPGSLTLEQADHPYMRLPFPSGERMRRQNILSQTCMILSSTSTVLNCTRMRVGCSDEAAGVNAADVGGALVELVDRWPNSTVLKMDCAE